MLIFLHLLDLDECAEVESLCDQICNNTFGSYMCSCELGYELVGELCEGEQNNLKPCCVKHIDTVLASCMHS